MTIAHPDRRNHLPTNPEPTFTQFWHRARCDALSDALADWREESAAVRAAYEQWSGTQSKDAGLAYAAYAAALEREERASHVLAEVVEDHALWVTTAHPAAT
ncbi:MAG TPA: hypothetical protein VLP43_01145 [Solirubrobacteraceae bacterium]|nr:hypothetical protein [Solirubrobacteraceae bacterium]